MADLLGGWKLLIIVVVILLLFGATRLPALARALGQSRNAFKSEMKKGEQGEGTTTSTDSTDTSSSDDIPKS
jgi:sec-independent protein translocase protein TatA